MRYRIEKDRLGSMQLPQEVYYGINSLRIKNNYEITKRGLSRQLIKALAITKKAAIKAAWDAEGIPADKAKAIIQACDEILIGKNHGQFITDLIQGGAGDAMHINICEILANRASEILGGAKGEYDPVSLDDCMKFQSTNDCVQTAGRIAIIKQIKKLIVELKKLGASFEDLSQKSEGFRMGRTHLNKVAPISYHDTFARYAITIDKNLKRLDYAVDNLKEVNMGGNILGNGYNTCEKYNKKVITYLNKYSSENLVLAKDLVEATSNLDSFLVASTAVKTLMIDLAKVAKDLRMLATDMISELAIPVVEFDSRIAPFKHDATICEVVVQVSMLVNGLDVSVSEAVSEGELELNVYLPLILMALMDEITTSRHAIRAFNDCFVSKINSFKESVVDDAWILSTHYKVLGYDKAIEILNKAIEENRSIKDILCEKKLFDESLLK